MSELTAAIGAKIYIGSKSWAHDTLAEYDGQASGWTEIGLAESVPEFGTKWETGSFTPVSDGRKRKYKTVQDNGALSITCARKGDDAGQVAVAAAADKQGDYPIKVELGDNTGGSGGKPTRAYFRALVTSATINPGGSSDTVKTTIGLDITTEVFVGEAAAGTP
ncbi:hypothetical protein [Azospirillum canadense]|uniref:hypothetical protein n=1 Tax=Azospirillum canadense TaxID=403962 RepID=UPI0022271656|nr:hypothetical protein [Azospirillum canadense]MCW2243577.1 hypothetical protein [Azospirillum canadense]